jgi:hypothetical protein
MSYKNQKTKAISPNQSRTTELIPPLRRGVQFPLLEGVRGSRLFKPTKTNHKTTASSPNQSLTTELIPPLSKRVKSGICYSGAANKYNYQIKTLILTPPGPLSEGEFGIPSFRGEIWDSPSERGLGESLLKSAKSQYDY